VIIAQTRGKGAEEVRRLQIAQCYTFPYLLYFLTAVQLTHVSECCRSHVERKASSHLGAHAFSCCRSFISRSICNEARTVSFACWKRHYLLYKNPSLWSTQERILLMTVASRLLLQSL